MSRVLDSGSLTDAAMYSRWHGVLPCELPASVGRDTSEPRRHGLHGVALGGALWFRYRGWHRVHGTRIPGEVCCSQCRLVKRVVGGPAGWFGGCIAVDGVRASWLENCDGYLFSRPGDRFWVGVCSAARGFPRCLAHVVRVAFWGEDTAGSVIRRRRMCSVRVKDNRSGSISTVSAASDMKARIA